MALPLTTPEATVADLYRVEEKGKAELVHGRIVHRSPTGGAPGRAGGRIYASLARYEEETGRGFAYPDNVGFIVDLPHRKSFSPDAAYHFGSDPGMRFPTGAPVFAVEVRSENDYGAQAERQIVEKRADYFAAGTQVVWDVDLLSPDVIRSYRASEPGTPLIFRRGDRAHAEPALPGWSLPVDDILPRRGVSPGG